MIALDLDYAGPSAVEAGRDRTVLALSASQQRPVRLHARIRRVLPLRLALQALGQVIWSDSRWAGYGPDGLGFVLDPVVTVHPDRVLFEAFSQDQGVYGLVSADRDLFEPEAEVVCGTTNVDFTHWLSGALAELRSSRETWLRIGPEGLGIQTSGSMGHFEKKVELPEEWVRGFLQLQEAMAFPGTRVSVRPVDILSAIRFLGFTRARIAPRALRYEFEPGADARLVLEPWEQVIALKGAEHRYGERRVIRVWGRGRLKLLEPLLPYADRVDVYLKGRALPSFYAVQLPGVTFLLGLSGWADQSWVTTGSFDLLTARQGLDGALVQPAIEFMRQSLRADADTIAVVLGVGLETATRLMARLARQGRVIYDLERRYYRYRELFAEPPAEDRLFPPDLRQDRAFEMLANQAVQVYSCQTRETRKPRRYRTPEGVVSREVIFRDWHVTGSAGDQAAVEVVVNDSGRLIFGTCGCTFFRDNLLNRGPCEHLIALLQASEASRADLPVANEAPPQG
jgi:hypothetical protein